MKKHKVDIHSGIIFIYLTTLIILNVTILLAVGIMGDIIQNHTFLAMVNLAYYGITAILLVRFSKIYLFKNEWPRFKNHKGFVLGMIIGGFFLMFALNSVVAVLYTQFDIYDNYINQESLLDITQIGWYNAMALFIFAVILAPLVEELVFRKGVFGLLEKHLGVIVAIIGSSFFFGFIHIISEPTNIIQLIPYMTLGLILAIIYFLSGRRIWVPITIHAIWNIMSFAFMFIPEDALDDVSTIVHFFIH